MKSIVHSFISEWNIRRASEQEVYSPVVTDSVRRIYEGLPGIQSIIVTDENDPIMVVWPEDVNGPLTVGHRADSGYDDDEGMFNLRESSRVTATMRAEVRQIVSDNGRVSFYTKNGHGFLLADEGKLCKLF